MQPRLGALCTGPRGDPPPGISGSNQGRGQKPSVCPVGRTPVGPEQGSRRRPQRQREAATRREF